MSDGRVAMIDGALFAPEDARVSLWDRGFLYGDGVFETMRTYGARVFAVEEHVARLARGARAIELDLPVEPSVLVDEVGRARAASVLSDAAVRLVVTRGRGPFGAHAQGTFVPTRAVLVDPLPPSTPFGESPGAVITAPACPPIVPGAKVTSYLPHLLASSRARSAGALDALLVDGAGVVREGATSNVFVVEAGVLVTPPEDGILPGITRAHVLRAATRLGLVSRFETLSVARILASDEAFLTSTFRELAPFASIDGRSFGAAERPVTRGLMDAFRTLTRA